LSNVAATSATGIEAEITYIATDNLTFDLSLGTINSKTEENNAVPPLIGISNTPDLTYNLAANYVIESDMGAFTIKQHVSAVLNKLGFNNRTQAGVMFKSVMSTVEGAYE
jgi:outer membrane receptor protein involved in Fe transport